MLDTHALSVTGRVGVALLALGLLIHHWNGPPGGSGGNVFLLAALFMGAGLVLLSDYAISEPGLRGVAKFCGYVGVAGIAIATFM
jgi:hypothetical protein